MKNKLLLPSDFRIAGRAWLLAVGLLAAASAAAQNFVKNPDFEEPLGTNNWTVEYAAVHGKHGGPPPGNAPTNCGPLDFLFAGRSTLAHLNLAAVVGSGTWDGEDGTGTNYWSKFGGHFAPNHDYFVHAYFKQIVKGLTPRAPYEVSAWMAFFSNNDGYLDKCDIYLEALGGPIRTTSSTTPYPTADVLNCQNHPENWRRYAVTTTASYAGEIEVRLHFNRSGTTASYWEYRNWNAFYDHVSVICTTNNVTKPFSILACTTTNQDLTLTWQSVMDNRYRIQYTRDLFDPYSWAFVRWSPKMDTNIYATGPTCTFKTNLGCLFSFDPSYDPEAPMFFRVRQWGFEP